MGFGAGNQYAALIEGYCDLVFCPGNRGGPFVIAADEVDVVIPAVGEWGDVGTTGDGVVDINDICLVRLFIVSANNNLLIR